MLLSDYKKISISFKVNTSNPYPEREKQNHMLLIILIKDANERTEKQKQRKIGIMNEICTENTEGE